MIRRLVLLSFILGSAYAESLTINVTTEGSREGVIAILVFKDQKGFPSDDKKAFQKGRFPVTSEGPVSCTITNLPYGNYSLSVLHDENNNYKADKILGFGPPKEPVGFSNIDKKLKRKPQFESTLITFSKDAAVFSIPLFYIF